MPDPHTRTSLNRRIKFQKNHGKKNYRMLLESYLINAQQNHYQSHENCDYLQAGSNSPKKEKDYLH